MTGRERAGQTIKGPEGKVQEAKERTRGNERTERTTKDKVSKFDNVFEKGLGILSVITGGL
jgi:hypothetical protein